MTVAEHELRWKRLSRSWWWLDPLYVTRKCEPALAWETLRRTKFYRIIWQRFCSEISARNKDGTEPSFEDVLRIGNVIETTRSKVGREYFEFLVNGFDPGLSWVDLSERQRLVAQGFVLGKREAIKANDEFLLPRQQQEIPTVRFTVIDLKRDEENNKLSYKALNHGCPLERLNGKNIFPRLTLKSGLYVMVVFDTRGSRDALLQAFDSELKRWVGNWRQAVKTSGEFAICWENGKPTHFWRPDPKSIDDRAPKNDVAIIPSDDPGYAILLVSMRHSPAIVKARFHTKLKTSQLREWHRQFVEYWKTVTVENLEVAKNPNGTFALDQDGCPNYVLVRRPRFRAERHLPPKKKRVKSAHRSNLWLGLAAYDVGAAGVSFGKKTREGAFLLGHCQSYTALKNHYRSAASRLQELEEEAETFQ